MTQIRLSQTGIWSGLHCLSVPLYTWLTVFSKKTYTPVWSTARGSPSGWWWIPSLEWFSPRIWMCLVWWVAWNSDSLLHQLQLPFLIWASSRENLSSGFATRLKPVYRFILTLGQLDPWGLKFPGVSSPPPWLSSPPGVKLLWSGHLDPTHF